MNDIITHFGNGNHKSTKYRCGASQNHNFDDNINSTVRIEQVNCIECLMNIVSKKNHVEATINRAMDRLITLRTSTSERSTMEN